MANVAPVEERVGANEDAIQALNAQNDALEALVLQNISERLAAGRTSTRHARRSGTLSR